MPFICPAVDSGDCRTPVLQIAGIVVVILATTAFMWWQWIQAQGGARARSSAGHRSTRDGRVTHAQLAEPS